MPFLPKKEPAPKDTSAFQGKPYLKREGIRDWLRRDEVWRVTKKPKEERVGLESKIFQRKEVGEFVDPKEAERIYKKMKDYPTESKKQYGIQSEGERYKILNMLKKFLGK